MYLSFFNLRKQPFHITPDPDFLYLSKSHKEAYGSLLYGVQNRKGFISITGEVGTGKTTIVRAFLEQCDNALIKPIYIFNADLPFNELLRITFRELGLRPEGNNIGNQIQQLQEFLIEEYRQERIIVLIVDEAQNMPVETLEKLRMLSNLETNKEKLIQIILVGQPELVNKINQQELRQLKQRLTLRATIHPLSHRESLAYIHHRLSLSSGDSKKIFSRPALLKISRFAKGFPRVLNVLCDNALIAGYGYKKRHVGISIIKEVIKDYQGKKSFMSAVWRLAPLIGFIFAIYVLFQPHLIELLDVNKQNFIDNQIVTSIIRTDNETQPFAKKKKEKTLYSLTYPSSVRGELKEGQISEKWNIAYFQNELDSLKKTLDQKISNDSRKEERSEFGKRKKSEEIIETQQESDGKIQNDLRIDTSFIMRVVAKGDVLSRLCVEIYGLGVYSPDLVQQIKNYNPHILDENMLQVGDRILFPVLDDSEHKIL